MRLQATSLLALVLVVSGCSHRLPTPSREAMQQSADLSENPVALLPHALERAKLAELDALTPGWYGCAKDANQKARSAETTELKERWAVTGLACLHEADFRANPIRGRMEEVVLQRRTTKQILSRIGEADPAFLVESKNPFEDDFRDIDDSLRKLTSTLERDMEKPLLPEKLLELKERYAALSKRAMKLSLFGRSRNRIRAAMDEGAKELVPQALNHTIQLVKEGESLVDISSENDEQLAQKRAEAEFYTARLLNLTRQSKVLVQKPPEELVTWLETRFHRLGEELEMEDVRDRTLEEQTNRLVSRIRQTQKSEISRGFSQGLHEPACAEIIGE